MATKANVSIDKMLMEAEKKVKKDLTEISSLIRHDFKEQAKNTLALYYSHYNPQVYDRTFNLFNNAIDEDIEFDDFSLSSGNSYGAWVHFTSNGMIDYVRGDKDIVLSNFMEGIHGRPSIYVEQNLAAFIMGRYQENYKKTLDGYFIDRGFTVN